MIIQKIILNAEAGAFAGFCIGKFGKGYSLTRKGFSQKNKLKQLKDINRHIQK